MVRSALKIIVFVALVGALTLAADWLSRTGGGVRIAFGDTELNLGAVQAAVVFVLLILAVWILILVLGLIGAFLRFANGDETAISRYFDRRSQRRGLEALAEGLTAIASGEGRVALAKAAKAERHLRRPDLTNLIAAQAAEMSGDTARAEQVYRRLLKDERTRFVGLRGLIKQRLQDGDTDTALKLAERAFAMKPGHVETGDLLLTLQAGNEDWSGARQTLDVKRRQGALPGDVHRRRDAALALQEARDVFRHGSTIEAREKAIEANRLSPDLIPAAVMAAQAYITDGKPRYAERVLTKAWAAQPHPDLAAAFASIAPEESPETRLKRFRSLLKQAPNHEETRLLTAELSIAAGDFAAAREAVGDLHETHPTARVLALMAAIDRGEGAEDHVVRAWLTRAVTAPRGPQWVCENCNMVHAMWQPVCDNCQAFDTIAWREPRQEETAMPGSNDLLPILVSAGEAPGEEPDIEAEASESASGAVEDDDRPPGPPDVEPIDDEAKP